MMLVGFPPGEKRAVHDNEDQEHTQYERNMYFRMTMMAFRVIMRVRRTHEASSNEGKKPRAQQDSNLAWARGAVKTIRRV